MPDYTVAGYDTAKITIHAGSDPFGDYNDPDNNAVGVVFSVDSEPDVFVITDNDPDFDETDFNQEVDANLYQNNGVATAGTDIDPEYIYLMRPNGSTDPSEYFEIYVYEAGIGPGADGFVTTHRMVPGQQYEIYAISGDNSPSIAYSSLYVCFTPGTMIATPAGEKRVELLGRGDLVRTVEGKFVPVRWSGARNLGRRELEQNPSARPIRIEAGALGGGLPERTMFVSQQHRIMLRSKIALRMFGSQEVLIAAKRLVGMPGINLVTDAQAVTYVHVLVRDHQVLLANGAPAESLFIGPNSRDMLPRDSWKEIKALLPDAPLKGGKATMTPARPFVDGPRANHLVERHMNNLTRPLVDTIATPAIAQHG